jgi:hypothetical protein
LALSCVRIRLDAAQLVKNDDHNAPSAEKRDERLTGVLAPPRRDAGFMRSAREDLEGS